jgi:hypothetical protein
VVEAVREGIAAAWDGLVNWFSDKLSDLTDMLPFSPAKTGPLRDLDRAGPGFVDEVLKGMETAMPRLQAAMAAMLTPGGDGGGGVTNQFDIQAVYRNFQSEASLVDDIRMLQLLSPGARG